jgi:hypothetical protein
MIEAGNMARFESLRPSWPEFCRPVFVDLSFSRFV